MKPRRFRIIVKRDHHGAEHHYVEQRRWWWPFWTWVSDPRGYVVWYCGVGDEGRYFAEQVISDCKLFDVNKNKVTIKEV